MALLGEVCDFFVLKISLQLTHHHGASLLSGARVEWAKPYNK
jgi:hypothetical protein